MPKPFSPKIVSANDLLVGDVVYLDGDGGWTRTVRTAAVAGDRDAADRLLAIAQAQPGTVVGPYLADVTLGPDGRPVPSHLRERIRDRGPTIRPDLGRQAEGAGRPAPSPQTGQAHVSL